MTEHNHPTAGFWIAVALVVVLLGYPLSFGPACWLCDHGFVKEGDATLAALRVVYSPIAWIHDHGPQPVKHSVEWYASLWGA